ncbi:hypothetical protein HC761_02375, partial [bacterium]|nr:hypothetical protein [bacterium]
RFLLLDDRGSALVGVGLQVGCLALIARAEDAEATLAMLTTALGDTATERDRMEVTADTAVQRIADMESAARALRDRNDEIFAKLEEAVTISMEPLDNMFRAAGLSPDDLLDQVRSAVIAHQLNKLARQIRRAPCRKLALARLENGKIAHHARA